LESFQTDLCVVKGQCYGATSDKRTNSRTPNTHGKIDLLVYQKKFFFETA